MLEVFEEDWLSRAGIFSVKKRVLLHYVGGFLLEHSKRVNNCQLTVFSCLSLKNSFK